MTLLLYSLPGSVCAWRVQLALEHKDIAYELELRGTRQPLASNGDEQKLAGGVAAVVSDPA